MNRSLKLRLLTATALIPAAVACVLFLETWLFAMLMGAIICLAAWEWSRLIGLVRLPWRGTYVLAVIATMYISYMHRFEMTGSVLIASALVFWGVVLMLVVRQQRGAKNPFSSSWLKALVGLMVLVPAWLSVVLLHSTSLFDYILLFLLVLVWTADSGAYFAGKRWGRVKLAARVSPGKTWEGLYGALAGSVLLVLLYVAIFDVQVVEIPVFFLICLTTVIVSVLGDLLESMMKRSVDLKDSGGLLPGHGGVLDRIDSLTAAAPVFFTGICLLEAL